MNDGKAGELSHQWPYHWSVTVDLIAPAERGVGL